MLTREHPRLRLQEAVSQPTCFPVLAFGGGVMLTCVLRILGRAGLPVYAVCDGSDFTTRSRWYRPLPGATNLKPDQLADFLHTLSVERAVLMPCADDWLRAVALLPAALTKRFPASIAPPAIIEALVDKWLFAQLLEQQGIPHPRTLLVTSPAELAALPDFAEKRWILKPLSSVHFARRYGVKGYVVRSRTEALRIMQEIAFPIMLQEYIPGPPTQGYFLDGFLDRDGQVGACFARQRLRMFPVDLGNSSLMVSVPRDHLAQAVAALNRLLAAVGYRGIFSAEFKYDPRDGLFKLLEINARPWWYIGFAASCGVDVCRMAYQDALGLPVEPVSEYQTGRRCVLLANDIRAYRELRRTQALGFRDWLRSWAGAEDTLLHWDDPRPALFYYGQLLWEALRAKARPASR